MNGVELQRCSRQRNQPGIVTVLVAGAMLIVTMIAAYLMQFSAGLSQEARIQNGADLAALAAASRHVQGFSDDQSCQTAEYIARKLPDNPQIVCTVHGDSVEVTVTANGTFAWLSPRISASATAGISL